MIKLEVKFELDNYMLNVRMCRKLGNLGFMLSLKMNKHDLYL